MAKPYRRRKNGKFVGNFRVNIDGRDLNLGTKDAEEARRRTALASKGKWPPVDAAAEAAQAALDPAAVAEVLTGGMPVAGGDAGAASVESGGEPESDGGGGVDAVPAPGASAVPAEPLHAAAAAAAVTADEAERVEAEQIEREGAVDGELRAIMSELGGGEGGADLLDNVCDGVAAGLLWAERKAIELGVNWTLKRRRSPKRLVTAEGDEKSIARRALKVGLKGVAVVHFPDISSKLTPGWAIAIGLVMGGGAAVASAKLVDVESGREERVADAVAAAQAQQQPQPPASPAA